jgi:hypothetical protein
MISGLTADLGNISTQLDNVESHMLSNDDYLSSMHISSINELSSSLTRRINKNSSDISVISNWIDENFDYFPDETYSIIKPKNNIVIDTNISSTGEISSTNITAVNATIGILSAKDISVDNIVPKNLSTDICVLVKTPSPLMATSLFSADPKPVEKETYIITSLYQTNGIIKIESELLNEGHVDGLVSDLENISSKMSGIVSSINELSGDLYECISETSSALSGDLIDTISSVSSDLYECITEVSGDLNSKFTISSNILCGAINTISSTISNFLSNEITSINSEIDYLSGHISTKIFVGNYISNDIKGDYSDLSVLKTTMDEYQ